MVFGILGLIIFVQALDPVTGGRSVIAAGLTMAVLVLPIVIITTVEALSAVPNGCARPATASAPRGGRSSSTTSCRTPRPAS